MSKEVCEIMSKEEKVVCPKCGGNLIYEAIGCYGTLYHLCQSGRIGRKLRTIKYEHSGDAMVYCSDCGINYDYRPTINGIQLLEEKND